MSEACPRGGVNASYTPGFGTFLPPGSWGAWPPPEAFAGTSPPLAEQHRISASARGRRLPPATPPRVDFATLGHLNPSVPQHPCALPALGPSLIPLPSPGRLLLVLTGLPASMSPISVLPFLQSLINPCIDPSALKKPCWVPPAPTAMAPPSLPDRVLVPQPGLQGLSASHLQPVSPASSPIPSPGPRFRKRLLTPSFLPLPVFLSVP